MDHVYDSSYLFKHHPGGRSIIHTVNKREVDRFLYGFFKPEMVKDIIIH